MSIGGAFLSHWLLDFYLLASVALALASAGLLLLRQPARRVTLGWATTLGLLLLAVLVALPAWPRFGFTPLQPAWATTADGMEPNTHPDAIEASSWLDLPALAAEQHIGGASVPAVESVPDPEHENVAVAAALNRKPIELPPPVDEAVLAAEQLPEGNTHWAEFVFSLFIGGCLLMTAWLALGALQTVRMRRQCESAPQRLEALFQRLVDARRRPRLGLSRAIRQPVALGLFRPAILLPACFVDEVPEEELSAALAHEWAHVRRGDLWLLALMRLLMVVLFAHPLYWWLRSRVRLDQEALADASAAARDNAIDYAAKLLHWARLGFERRGAVAALALWERPSQLKRRVTLLLNPGYRVETQCPRYWRFGSALAALVGVSVLSLVTLRPADAGDNQRDSTIKIDSLKAEKPAERLRYRFKPGESYIYAVQVEGELDQYVEVHGGHSVYQVRAVDGDGVTLAHRGGLVQHRRPKPGAFGPGMARLLMPPFAGMGRQGPRESELKIDSTGKVLRASGGASMPFALGDLPRLVFERLPADDQEAWETRRECTVEEAVLNHADEPAGPPFGPMGIQRRNFGPIGFRQPFAPFGFAADRFEQAPKTSYQADETVTYSLGLCDEERIDINKKYRLTSLDKLDEEPRLQLAGEGFIAFDLKVGLVKAMEFKGTLKQSTANLTYRVPVRLTYRLLDEAERDRVLNPPPPVKVEPQPLGALELDGAVADLKDADKFKRRAAASRLAAVLADEARREEVAKLLEAMLDDADLFTRQAGVKGLGAWGRKESVSLLIERVEDEQHAVRWAAFEALGKLRADESAEALAKRLTHQADRHFVSQALQQLGPTAETHVAKYLRSEEWTVRLEACKVLKAVGTLQSKPALETAAKDSNGLVANFATEALRAVQERAPANVDE